MVYDIKLRLEINEDNMITKDIEELLTLITESVECEITNVEVKSE